MNFRNEGTGDEDYHSFRQMLKSSPFLQREEEYVKMNMELEKKSNEIFQKIETFSMNKVHPRERSFSLKNPNNISSSEDGDEGDHVLIYRGNGDCEQKLSYSTRRELSTATSPTTIYQSKVEERRCSTSRNVVPFHSPGRDSPIVHYSEEERKVQRARESIVRCLQAKLSNHEERLADLHLQYRQKIQENTILESKLKSLEDERERLLRNVSSLNGTVEKHRQSAETSRASLNVKINSINNLKREIEDLKKEKKSSQSSNQALQKRTHRTLEENEKLKAQNKSLALHLKEVQSEYKARTEEQQQRIARLEHERSMFAGNLVKGSLSNLKANKKFGTIPKKPSELHIKIAKDMKEVYSDTRS